MRELFDKCYVRRSSESDFPMKTESNGIVTLTAAEGYSDYKWYLDASSAVVSEKATYSFTPSEGYTMVFVTAKKNGVTYSAIYYISLKK